MGEGEHEDEIEEQLERDDRVALTSLDRFTCGHALVRLAAVLVVSDVFSPLGRALGDRDVGHEVVVARAVPVLLTVGCDVDVARTELDEFLPSRLDKTSALGDVERLAAVVRMPRGSGAWGEVHGADAELRLPFGLDDRVDPHVAGEPLCWALDGRFPPLRLHNILLVEIGHRSC